MKPINIDEKRKIFLLNTRNWSYGFCVNGQGHLTNLHWGGPVRAIEDLPLPDCLLAYTYRKSAEQGILKRQEYPGCGDAFYDIPALKVSFPDGSRSTVLVYDGHQVETNPVADILTVSLRDKFYPLGVRLFYRIYNDCDILERWCEITNHGEAECVLDRVMSATLSLPRIDGDYRLTHLWGRWGGEGMINRIPVRQNRTVLESRTGLSGPFNVPYFALDQQDASERQGYVWFGSVEWSGNWQITVYRDAYDEVSVTGGINDFDFTYPLAPQESFVTPVFCCGVSQQGFGGASRILHDYQRLHLLPPVARNPIPLIVNTWASLHADVDETSVRGILEKAAEVGAELFVIDDGWQAALGDWTPDPQRFPRGLKPLVERARELGMAFGLWVEIESFEKRSNLFKIHPDWAMKYKNRPLRSNYREDVDRTSYLINFAREDVRKYFAEQLKALVLKTGITYLKLDMNYMFTDPGWDEVPPQEQQTIWYHYTNNIYRLFAELTEVFPDLRIENCASGGGRSDLGMSRYFSRINRSDNQDPLDILKLHEGFTMLHLPGLAGGGCHISDDMGHINARQLTLTFQAIAGMLGSLAIGKNLALCPQEELDAIREWANLYKRLRHIVYHGQFYKLVSHYDHPYAAYQYVSHDRSESLLFVFAHAFQFGARLPAIRLEGLTPDAVYTVEAFGNTSSYMKDYRARQGQSLMAVGIQIDLLGDYQACIMHFKKAGPVE